MSINAVSIINFLRADFLYLLFLFCADLIKYVITAVILFSFINVMLM